jgi:hypothetical protein
VTEAPIDAAGRRPLGVAAWAVTAAFGTYFCMYGFRKPFTAASYSGQALGAIEFKTALVTAQVLGYMVSKFIGIKVVAEMSPRHRAAVILVLIGTAHLALLGFALAPAPYNVAFLFLNGLPLGMVFGLVLRFLEGRQATEALTAGLCASFILADGVTKSIGATLLEAGVTEAWMPFAAGLVFVPPLLVGTWMLSRLPPPSAKDVTERSHRPTLTRADRASFLRRHAAVLIPLVAMFVLVTVLRSIRADFQPEIWRGFGVQAAPAVFTQTESIVALVVTLACGAPALVRSNRQAMNLGLAVCLAGLGVVAVALISRGATGGFTFLVLTGLGIYLPYVAVHTTIFERLIALTRDRGNLGWLMQVADAAGYLGYVSVMLGRGAFPRQGDFLTFFAAAAWLLAAVSAACVAVCWWNLASRRATSEAVRV